MRLACPACGAEMTLDVLLGTEAARDAVLLALQLPAPLGKLVLQYVALFRPPKRQLSWERVAALFAELALPIAEARIERHGRVWAAPLEYWRAAFEEITAKRDGLTLPLKSHGYLYEIILGYANKAEALNEKKTEADRGRASSRTHDNKTAPMSQVLAQVAERQMPAAVRDRLVALGTLKPSKKEQRHDAPDEA